MDTSNLSKLIRSFSAVELRDLRRFLHSPFFNLRQDLIDLFEWLCLNPDARKESVWKHLFGDMPYDDQKLRLHLSYLHRLLEKYLIVKESTADDLNNQISLAVAYRKRNNPESLSGCAKVLKKRLKISLYEMPIFTKAGMTCFGNRINIITP